jgi:hypothetical protein
MRWVERPGPREQNRDLKLENRIALQNKNRLYHMSFEKSLSKMVHMFTNRLFHLDFTTARVYAIPLMNNRGNENPSRRYGALFSHILNSWQWQTFENSSQAQT